jgi:LysR family glycine cleavage system transcriptional activator
MTSWSRIDGSAASWRSSVFDTAAMAIDYALAGSGLALADPRLFADEIADGRLARPFALAVDDGFCYGLKVHPDDREDPDITALAAWLTESFGDPRGEIGTIDPLQRALAIRRRSGT